MKHFIDSVQEYIANTFDDLQQVEIIVPNNRTGSALLSSLKKNATKVSWAPKITPIKEIFAHNAKIQEAENVVMIYTLYKIFANHINASEGDSSFDNFYNFGEVLLSDFDDIDKYLVNPQKLFCNIADAKEIDIKFIDLEDDLMKILQSFWQNISNTSVLDKKMKSLELWQKMPAIYEDFTKALREKGIGYQGLIYRDFVENRMLTTDFDSENYAFVGFSALNECEKSLFRHIREITRSKNGQCLFFWDADKYYIDNKEQEAGLFLRADLKEFPLPKGFELSDTITNLYKKENGDDEKCKVQVIEVPSAVAQTKIIPKLLENYNNLNSTAIILGDEKLLVPLIYSLPKTLKINGEEKSLKCNITMGYPLSYTASASFVQIIMKLAMHRSENKSQGTTYFNRKDIFSAIMHSFSRTYIWQGLISKINNTIAKCKIDYIDIESIREEINSNELLKVIFDTAKMDESFPKYIISVCQFVYENILSDESHRTESDFMHRIITLYTSFLNALGNDIAFERDNMYYKLMTSIIKKSNMAFDSNTDEPLQILGFMETRSLDFDNIIMLSMNEDTFPKSSYKDSMIPYNLRKAFSMPSIEFQNSIFAYYFYRLLQRSRHIQMLYCTEGKISHAEQSRFITQIEYERRDFDDTVNQKFHTTRSYEIRPSQTPTIEIEKADHIKEIQDLLGYSKDTTSKEDIQIKKGVFPKLINTYLKCPLSFYFEYIEGLKEEENLDDDTSALDFGNLLHESCHFLYRPYIGKSIEKEDFATIKSNIEKAINFAVSKVFNVKETDKAQFDEAKSNIMLKPLRKYLNKIVATDEEYAPFQIVDLENEKIHNGNKDRNYTIEYTINDKTKETVLLKGIIDRIDLKDKKLRVIDYKTSSIKNDKKTYNEKFWFPETFKNKEAAQVLIYSEIMSQLKSAQEYTVQPYIISVTNLNDGALKAYKKGKEKKGGSATRTKQDIDDYKKQSILLNDNDVKLSDDVNENLKGILNELLDPEKKITQTKNIDNCEYCPYNKICNRNN